MKEYADNEPKLAVLDSALGGVGPILPQDNEVGDEEELVVDEEVVADVPTLKFPDILNH